VFFTALSLAVFGIVNAQAKLAKNIESRIICNQLAKAAVLYYGYELDRKTDSYITTFNLKQEKKMELGLGSFIYILSDEEAKLDLNRATSQQIAALPGMNLELADNIYGYPDKPFRAIEQVMEVEGMDEEIFEKIKDYVTVFAPGRININTAPKEVLKTFLQDDALVSSIEDYRNGDDGLEGTQDDKPFKDPVQIVKDLNEFTGLSASQVSLLNQFIIQGFLVTNSRVLTLNIDAQIIGKSAMKYAVIMDNNAIRQWREW